MNTPHAISVIISTYNSPLWLEKVLHGYACQTFRQFEIVIADDGSGDETRRLIEGFRRESGLPVTHVWQEDRGFRKCRILNKAVLKSRYDYLLFTDGDCIPRADFLAVHAAEARPGYFLSGSYYKLPLNTSEAITLTDISSGRCFQHRWLRRHGLGFWRKRLKVVTPKWLAPLFNRLTPARCNLKGSNASAWKRDVLAVNGFDERMPWGGEDREFGVRLINHGVRPKHVRYNAVVLHLDHARGYVDAVQVENNKRLRLHNERHRIRHTDYGISRLASETEQARPPLELS